MKALLQPLIDWYLQALDSGGYWLVGLLMAIESSIVPLPSELVIPPAAHLAHTTGKLSMTGIIIAGTIGSWVGAAVMYWAARWAGRPLILKYGKYCLVSAEKVQKAERWAARFGSLGVFIARLLPVVRHLIGIPMGIVKMDFKLYSIFTLIGSAIWVSVLCWIGVKLGADLKETVNLTHTLSKWFIVGSLGLGGVYYFFVHRYMKET